MAYKDGQKYIRLEPDRFGSRDISLKKRISIGEYQEGWGGVVQRRERASMILDDGEIISLHKMLGQYIEQMNDVDDVIFGKPDKHKSFKDIDSLIEEEELLKDASKQNVL